MKFMINRLPMYAPWGGGAHFVNAFHDQVPTLGHQLLSYDSSRDVPDAVLLMGLNAESGTFSADQAVVNKVMLQPQHDVKLILRVNENDARKNTHHVDRAWIDMARHVDGAVFVSEWQKQYFMERGWPKSLLSTVIINGVNDDIFKSGGKLNNGKTNVVMAHWSDNPMKGQDYAEWLDDFVGRHPEFTFTFVGRSKASFRNSEKIGPFHARKLGEELGKFDVCVNASRFDPGPNSVIESISCGLPTYVHVDGGGAVEFAGKDHAFSTPQELEKILLGGNFTDNAMKFRGWRTCIEEYIAFAGQLCQPQTSSGA